MYGQPDYHFLCGLFVCYKNCNKIVLYKTYKKRNSRLATFLFSCFLFLSGCGKTGALEAMQVIYNSTSSDSYWANDFFVKAVEQGENAGIFESSSEREDI